MLKQPAFWSADHRKSLLGRALAPLGCLYRAATRLRDAKIVPYRSRIPVICIGNIVAGGAGKTPVAISLAQGLSQSGRKVCFLSRGYGGNLAGPLLVSPDKHDASQVGDEPLLLARIATVVVSRDRVAGIKLIESQDFDVVIMDDGYQNPTLAKTVSLLVIDGGFGLGSERLLPAGPLRETVSCAFEKCDGVVILGRDKTGFLTRVPDHLDVIQGIVEARPDDIDPTARYVAFAGIGRPEKFRDTLEELGLDLAGFHAFPDHHPFRPDELDCLTGEADRKGARLITTEKDHVRLPEDYKSRVRALPVSVTWTRPEELFALVNSRL